MSVLTNTKLETHPATTPAKNSIINVNWQQLENIFTPGLSTSDPVYQLILKALVKNASPSLTDGYMLVYRTGTSRLNLELVDLGNATKLQGRTLDSAAPVTGEVLIWDGSKWTPDPVNATKIQGTAVHTVAPTDGQSLVYVAANNRYEASAPAGNATQIQGRAMAATAPTDGQVILWDNAGTTWKPGGASGDATKIQGRDVSATAPTTDQALVWNGSLWAPADQSGTGGGGGGVTVYSGNGVLQTKISQDATYRTLSTAIPVDDTIPQNTEGDQILTASITPKSENSTIYAFVDITGAFVNAANTVIAAALFKDSGADAIAAGKIQGSAANNAHTISFAYSEASASLTARTFNVRIGPNTGTAYLHGNSSGRHYGGVMKSTLRVIEVLESGTVLEAPPWLQNHPDSRPATADSLDDEFDGATLNTSTKWTWVNQGSATATLKNSALILKAPAGSGNNMRMVVQTPPSPTYRISTKDIRGADTPKANPNGGLCLRDSSGGKCIKFGLTGQSTGWWKLKVDRMTNFSTFSVEAWASVENDNWAEGGAPIYLRITNDGTNLNFSASNDGVNWLQVWTETIATFISAVDQVGLYSEANNATYDHYKVFQYFRVDSGTDKAKETLLVDRVSVQVKTSSKTLKQWHPLDNESPSSNYPVPVVRNSIVTLAFDGTVEETTYFKGRIPENSNLGSGLRFLFEFISATATTGNVVWGIAVMRCNTDLDTDSFDTAAEVTVATNATSGIPALVTITTTNIDGAAAGDLIRVKLYRKAADAADTMDGDDAEITSFEMQSVAEPDSRAGTQVGGIVTESTTARSLTVADIGKYIRLTNASSCTITIPTDASAGWDLEDFPPFIMVRVAAAGIPTLSHTGVTVNDDLSVVANLATGSVFALQWVAANTWDVI